MSTRAKRKRPKAQPDAEISIGAMAKELGISTATINFYVAEGVVPPPRKLNRTRAAYSHRHVRIVRIVKRMQAMGYSLAQVRQFFAHWGTEEAGLAKIEGIGSLQPIPPPRNDPEQEPIEHFAPVTRERFLQLIPSPPGVDARALLDAVDELGIIGTRGGYDAGDLWLVRMIISFMRDGLTLDDVATLRVIIDAARALAPLVLRSVEHNRELLSRRELRFRDITRPYTDVLWFAIDRALDSEKPGWRGAFAPLPGSAMAAGPPAELAMSRS